MDKKPDKLDLRYAVSGLELSHTQEPRSVEEHIHELQRRQVELEMQNEQLRQALVDLEKSRNLYANFYDFSPVGYLTIDHDAMIGEINLTGAELLGMERNLLRRSSFTRFVSQKYRGIWARHLLSVFKNDGKLRCELPLERDDGSCLFAQMDCLRMEKEGENPTVRMVLTDITARVQAEKQLLNSMRELEKKELSKTRFLAAAGHDLRQPVAAANLFVDALKLTSPTPRQSELIARLDQSMSVFSGLLERLLDISKFDAGLIKPQVAPYNLAKIFHWLEQNFAQTAHSKHLRFRLYFPANKSLLVCTDIGLLQSVLMNLVSNAIKFTMRGGILVSARLRGDRILLQVWDTGIGIAGADLPHIFEEFYQAANLQRNREVGLGLGLSICKRAMSLLEGEVNCRSRPGFGSVFELHLPVNGERRKTERLPIRNIKDKIADEILFDGKRVVVVEDDILVANGLVSLLQGLGAEVRYFHNAEEALRQADIASADFFIAGYSLGGKLNGFQFLEALQQKQQIALRAVVLTGDTSSQFISSVADSPWPVLHKPVSYAKLAASMRY